MFVCLQMIPKCNNDKQTLSTHVQYVKKGERCLFSVDISDSSGSHNMCLFVFVIYLKLKWQNKYHTGKHKEIKVSYGVFKISAQKTRKHRN